MLYYVSGRIYSELWRRNLGPSGRGAVDGGRAAGASWDHDCGSGDRRGWLCDAAREDGLAPRHSRGAGLLHPVWRAADCAGVGRVSARHGRAAANYCAVRADTANADSATATTSAAPTARIESIRPLRWGIHGPQIDFGIITCWNRTLGSQGPISTPRSVQNHSPPKNALMPSKLTLFAVPSARLALR